MEKVKWFEGDIKDPENWRGKIQRNNSKKEAVPALMKEAGFREASRGRTPKCPKGH